MLREVLMGFQQPPNARHPISGHRECLVFYLEIEKLELGA